MHLGQVVERIEHASLEAPEEPDPEQADDDGSQADQGRSPRRRDESSEEPALEGRNDQEPAGHAQETTEEDEQDRTAEHDDSRPQHRGSAVGVVITPVDERPVALAGRPLELRAPVAGLRRWAGHAAIVSAALTTPDGSADQAVGTQHLALRKPVRRPGTWLRSRRLGARLGGVSHPSLGLPPIDRTSTLPPTAARVNALRDRLAGRALEIALDRDPTLRDRHDEYALRRLLRDTGAFVDQMVNSIAANDPQPARVFAEAVPPAYRRRKVPMDDLVTLAQAVRDAVGGVLAAGDMGPVDAAAEAMIERFRWHARIAGDGRRRNRLLQAIYKGA
jgi:hypothetical protein